MDDMDKSGFHSNYAVCTTCGWVGPYLSAKHLSHNQLVIRGVTNESGHIIDPYLLNLQRRNGGHVDLTWCPKCDCFIEVYYEETEKIKG
jgi:hypothetical protein